MRTTLIGVLILLCNSSLVLADNFKLTSLSWPPYTDPKLVAKGSVSAVVQAAFQAEGHNLIIDFYPWSRAVKLAQLGTNYVGYFPEYDSKENRNSFYYSESVGSGPLVLVEPKSKPISWNNYDDLKKYKLGVVANYINTEQLDKMIASKEIRSDTATNDLINIKKLSGGRVDAIVIDSNVFDFLLKTEPSLANERKTLQINSKILEKKSLYVCFTKNKKGKEAMEILNQGLKKIDVDSILRKVSK